MNTSAPSKRANQIKVILVHKEHLPLSIKVDAKNIAILSMT